MGIFLFTHYWLESGKGPPVCIKVQVIQGEVGAEQTKKDSEPPIKKIIGKVVM